MPLNRESQSQSLEPRELRQLELTTIERRRQKAEVTRKDNELFGVAFSGGGVRSATFCLGFLQALQTKRIWNHVDYLSAVSGGSYLAGHLVSQSVDASPDGAKPASGDKAAKNLKASRGYLFNRPVQFVLLYGFGLLLNTLVFGSLVIGICSLLALLWRMLDWPWLHYEFLLWTKDATRPFLPPLLLSVLLAIVYVVHGFQTHGREDSRWITGLFWAALAAWITSLAVLASNVEISGPDIMTDTFAGWFKTFVATVGFLVSPVLYPTRFLRSGTVPGAPKLERVVFQVTGIALLVGLPAILIYFFAREDFANTETKRVSFLRQDVWDWDRLFAVLKTDYPCKFSALVQDGLLQETLLLPGVVSMDVDATEDEVRKALQPASTTGHERRRVCRVQDVVAAAVTRHFVQDGFIANAAVAQILCPECEKAFWSDVQQSYEETLRDWPHALQYLTLQAPNDQKKKELRALARAAQAGLKTGEQNAAEQFVRTYLEMRYPGTIKSRQLVSCDVVWAPDQWRRLRFLCGSAVILLLISFLVSPNGTSLHKYYMEQISEGYLGDKNKPLGLESIVRASEETGLPYVLINATMNVPTARLAVSGRTQAFLFSGHAFGSQERPDQNHKSRTQQRSSSQDNSAERPYGFERSDSPGGDERMLAMAMAVSGAAFTPLVVPNVFVAFVTTLLNFRLGAWVANPRRRTWYWRINWLSVFRDLFRKPVDRKLWFVSDGGHHDNLGIEALLKRKCRLIIACDASADPKYQYEDFARILSRATTELGITFQQLPLSPKAKQDASKKQAARRSDAPRSSSTDEPPKRKDRDIKLHPPPPSEQDEVEDTARPDRSNGSQDRNELNIVEDLKDCKKDKKRKGHPRVHNGHWQSFMIKYPGEPGLPGPGYGILIYVKPSLTGDEGINIWSHARRHPEFPHDPTVDQDFSEQQFDAYRLLGQHIGEQLCQNIPPEEYKGKVWKCELSEIIRTLLVFKESENEDIVGEVTHHEIIFDADMNT